MFSAIFSKKVDSPKPVKYVRSPRLKVRSEQTLSSISPLTRRSINSHNKTALSKSADNISGEPSHLNQFSSIHKERTSSEKMFVCSSGENQMNGNKSLHASEPRNNVHRQDSSKVKTEHKHNMTMQHLKRRQESD